MGVWASTCCGGGTASRRLTLLCIGLDGGGKSTLLSALGNPAEVDPPVVPTVGFSQPTHKRLWGYDVTIYDLGGGARIRGVWPHYFADVHGVVYVVDAADSKRMTEAAEELQSALLHPMIVGKPLLVFANKQDLPAALDAQGISSIMKLDKLATLCRHHVQAIIAKPIANGGVFDERVMSGLQWLIDAIGSDLSSLHTRREREMKIAATAEAERKAKARADYETRKAAREAAAAAATAAATAPPGNAGGAVAAGQPSDPSAATRAAATEQTKKPATAIMCTSCKVNPAAKRCAASGWQAVCMPCADRLEGKLSDAGAAADAGSGSAAASAPASATTSTALPTPVRGTEEQSKQEGGRADHVTSDAPSDADATAGHVTPADHSTTQAQEPTTVPSSAALVNPSGPICAECKEATATRKATIQPGAWVPVCASCGARIDAVRAAQAASAIEAAMAAPGTDVRHGASDERDDCPP